MPLKMIPPHHTIRHSAPQHHVTQYNITHYKTNGIAFTGDTDSTMPLLKHDHG